MKANLVILKNTLSKSTGRVGLLLKKNSPEILMVAGVAGIVTSTVLACKATLKVESVLDNMEMQKNKINTVWEKVKEGEIGLDDYSDLDHKKDLTIVYVQSSVELIKLYGPAILVGTAAIGCFIGSHKIMQRRNLAVIAAYKTIEQSFADYRKRVIEEYGEDKDRMYKYGIKEEKVTISETDADGKTTKVKKTIKTIDPNDISQYARFFDESSSQWTKTPEYNFTFLKCQQNYANDLLQSRGHVFLNEVYDMLGLQRSQAGAVVGWVLGEGDGYVDFGMFDVDNVRKRDFVNGYERSILLDFNVDGIIYDLI